MAQEHHAAETAVEHVAEHAGDHAGSAFPPFDFATFPSQLFWLAISFAILYILLSRMVLPRLGGIIEARKGKIASDLDNAASMKSEADAKLAEMDKELAAARADARSKAEQTRAAIDANIAEITATKTAELDARLAESEARIETMKATAMANVSEIAVATTSAILEQLGTKATAKAIKASVDKSLEGASA